MPPSTKAPLSREIRKRLAAARAYAELSHSQLGKKLGVSRDTVRRAEAGETTYQPHEAEALLRRAADACAVPFEFFTVDFRRMPELAISAAPAAPDESLVDQVRAVLQTPAFRQVLAQTLLDIDPAVLRRIADGAENAAAVDPLEQEARAASRELTGAAADLLDTYARDDEAADSPRDEADATPEAPRAHGAGNA